MESKLNWRNGTQVISLTLLMVVVYSFQYLSGFGILGAIAVFVDVSSSSSR